MQILLAINEKKNGIKKKKYDEPRCQMLEEKLNFRLLIVLHFAYDLSFFLYFYFYCVHFGLTANSGVALHSDYLLIYFNLCDVRRRGV